MAKKENSPAISFFSFQDIITSITGIMFLVVMMLVLLAVTRSAKLTPEEKAVDRQILTLQKQLADLKRKISADAMSRDDLRRRVEELKKLDLASLESKKEALLREMERIAASVAQEKRSRAELKRELALIRQRIDQSQADGKNVQMETESAERSLQESSAEKERLSKQLKHSEKLIRFTWKGNTGKRPLLAVCAKEEISVQDGLTGKPLFSAKGHGGVLQGQFLVWCRSQESRDHYFVLLVKPSAFHYIEELSSQLKKLGFERGREILPSDDLDVVGDH